MGTCITVIKFAGASSLGLLSGNLAFQSYKKIPDLIRQINNQVTISSTAAASVLKSVTQNIIVSGSANVFFAALSTYLFSTAYKYSPPSGKHPYLLYCAVGAPLALILYSLKAWGSDGKILKRACVQKKVLDKKKTAKKPEAAAPVAPVDSGSDDSSLGKSYIHVSDSLSSTTTPSSSTPNSPQQPATDLQPTTSAIEQEVEEALNKKEYIKNMETIRGSHKTALAFSGAAFTVSAIGLVGEYFLN